MNQIEKKREREKQMLQESCLRLYDLLENEKETAGGVDRGEQSQLRRVLQYYHLPLKESAAGLQHENIEHMLRRSGLITRRITLDGAWWKEASVPLLLTDEEGKQYTAIPSGGGRYCVWRDGKEQRLNSQNTTDFQSIAISIGSKRNENGMAFPVGEHFRMGYFCDSWNQSHGGVMWSDPAIH